MHSPKALLKKILNRSSVDERINKNIKNFVTTINPKKIEVTLVPKFFDSKVEILIPCYNHGKFLPEAFKSIQDQTIKSNLNVTFINDNSSDDSLSIMKSLASKNRQKFIKVKIIDNPKNLLQTGSLNKAIKESKNELFVILNADDLLTPDCIDLIIKTYQANSDIFLLGGSSLWFESGGELPKFTPKPMRSLKLSKYGPNNAKNFKEPNDINMSQSSCSFFKSAWELVGGYYPLENRVCSHDDRDFQMRVCSVLPIGIYEGYPMTFYRSDSSLGRGII